MFLHSLFLMLFLFCGNLILANFFKKKVIMKFNLSLVLLLSFQFSFSEIYMKLEKAPDKIEQVSEIATQYNQNIHKYWNNLNPQERIFAYYMYRASIPGNRIVAQQKHRHAIEVRDLFKFIFDNKKVVEDKCQDDFDVNLFLSDVQDFLFYLLAHHCQYFAREFEDHKRTPERMGLKLLNKDNLLLALNAAGFKDAQKTLEKLNDSIFKTDYEPTLTVSGSIENSAINMYSHDFTDEDYQQLSADQRSGINNYFEIENLKNKRVAKVRKYKIGDVFSKELEVAHFWIQKAFDHTSKHPEIFDENIPASLKHMLLYLESGDEEQFKEFCKKWLKTNSRVDFNFGFIEVYEDPKQCRGSFEADITIKTIDMKKLNSILPKLEEQLPFPKEFKRENLNDIASIPNASLNAKLFGSGDSGPVFLTAAYCLPNYAEIRSEYGSKQIIYESPKDLGELVNADLNHKIFNIKESADFKEQYDKDKTLEKDIWNVQVVLHETLGHGSGRLHKHIFVEGENLTIGGKTYQVGDQIDVTAENITEFLGRYFSGHEELRAEIMALYVSIFNFDELEKIGLLKDWPQKIGKEKLIERLIIHMAEMYFKRLLFQKEDATEIVQAHAQANTTITNYLLDHGGLELVEEKLGIDGKEHTVLGIRVTDLEKAKQAVKDLAIEVQRIKSTGDGIALNNMMKKYGACVRNPEYIKIMKDNRNAVQGNLKEIVEIFPNLEPVRDDKGEIVDVSATWSSSFLEKQLGLINLEFSKK